MPANKKSRDDGKVTRGKVNYEVLDDTLRGGKESYGEEPPCYACDRKRCLNGRCGVGWLPIVGLGIATGICAVLIFSGVIGFSFETDGTDTLAGEIYTDEPTSNPTSTPTFYPTSNPTVTPTLDPTADPTLTPTDLPTSDPTSSPTAQPTVEPTFAPTDQPTYEPTNDPTADPTGAPTVEPSSAPTDLPTLEPTAAPSGEPTGAPTNEPTVEPTSAPTGVPTTEPTADPTVPTYEPTNAPTAEPTTEPTSDPTVPTSEPTNAPTSEPSVAPTAEPTSGPTNEPTSAPTNEPSSEPSSEPTSEPTSGPTTEPTAETTDEPTAGPTVEPTAETTDEPTAGPTVEPTSLTTVEPTVDPTSERRRGYNLKSYPNILILTMDGKFYSSFETPNVNEFLKESHNFKNVSFKDIEDKSISKNSLLDEVFSRDIHEYHDGIKLADLLRWKGYTNYYYRSCLSGKNSCQSSSTGRGWDYWYTAVDHPSLVIRSSGLWRRERGKCETPPNKTLILKKFSLCLTSCYEHEAALFDERIFNCQCFHDASKCFASFEEGSSNISLRKNPSWWINEDTYYRKVGNTTSSIVEKVLSDLVKLKKEKWMITMSLETNDRFSARENRMNNAIYNGCKGNLDFDEEVECRLSLDNDVKFGKIIDTLKVNGLWDNTIVFLIVPHENDSIFSVGGGALPAVFLSSENDDFLSVVDVVPTIMRIAGFSDSEPEFNVNLVSTIENDTIHSARDIKIKTNE